MMAKRHPCAVLALVFLVGLATAAQASTVDWSNVKGGDQTAYCTYQ